MSAEKLRRACEQVAADLAVPLHRLTLQQAATHEAVTYHALRALGPWASVKRAWWPDAQPRDIKEARRIQVANSYTSKLERQVGDARLLYERITEELRDHLATWRKPRFTRTRKRTPKRMLTNPASDLQTGELVEPSETGNINRYNLDETRHCWDIILREMVSWKPAYRDHTRANLVINGDAIHGDLRKGPKELLGVQVAEFSISLARAVEILADEFPHLHLVILAGNHDRFETPSKPSGRQYEQKWDSFLYPIGRLLQERYKGCERVTVDVPKSASFELNLLGSTALVTHGDTEMSVGNPRRRPDISALSSKILSYQAARQKSVDLVLLGHYHYPTLFWAGKTQVIINGCWSGTNPHGQALGDYWCKPGQFLFESVPGHPVGDLRFIDFPR